jgi:hypothetical protein
MNLPLFPAKIVLALLVPLVAGVCLGWLGLVRFDDAGIASDILAAKTGSPAALFERLERHVLLTAYNLRGYIKSGEKPFLDKAKRELAAAMETLHALRPMGAATLAGDETTAETSRNASFGASSVLHGPKARPPLDPSLMDKTVLLLGAYKEQAELVVAAYDSLSSLRKVFYAAAGAYAAAVAEAEKVARDKLDLGLSVQYPPLNKVRLRRRQLDILGQAARFGVKVFDAGRQASLDRKPSLLSDASKYFIVIRETLDRYEATGLVEEADNLAAMRGTASVFEGRSQALLGGWMAVAGAEEKLLRDESALMEASSAMASRALEKMDAFARKLTSDLAWSRRMMQAGMLVLGLFGVVWIVLAVTALSAPVVKCARYARELAKGDAKAPLPALSAGGRGETGVLAEALREIAGRLGRS